MILHRLKTNKFNNDKPGLRDLFPVTTNPQFSFTEFQFKQDVLESHLTLINTATPLFWPEEKLGQAVYRFF